MKPRFYAADLAYIHDAGFNGYARSLAPGLIRVLRAITNWQHTWRSARRQPLIVEIGCGGGSTARTLVGAGFDVVGIDRSAAVLRLARRRAPNATFRLGSWATARFPSCSAIFGIGEVVSYMTGSPRDLGLARLRHRAELQQFFNNAYGALHPGGVLLFDFMETPRGRTYRRFTRGQKDWGLEMRASADRSRTVIVRQLSMTRRVGGRLRRSRETHLVRIYTRKEMGRMLRDAGFKVWMARSIGRRPVFRSNAAALCVKPGGQPRGIPDSLR